MHRSVVCFHTWVALLAERFGVIRDHLHTCPAGEMPRQWPCTSVRSSPLSVPKETTPKRPHPLQICNYTTEHPWPLRQSSATGGYLVGVLVVPPCEVECVKAATWLVDAVLLSDGM